MKKHVLVSGAGIAGPVVAYWLARHGWQVTVIERSDSLRLGGQNIDFSDAARDIIRMMGLEASVKERHTGEKGLQFVDTNNVVKAGFPVSNNGSLTKEIEILRGDLVELLVNATKDSVEYRFGTSIKALENRDDEVRVTFADGAEECFDIVIAADGMNSVTRSLVIGDGDYEAYLGCWSSYFTVPRQASDNDWWRWYTSPTGVIAFLRPDNKGTMRACVNFLSEQCNPPYMSLENKRDILRERMRGAGWECERLSNALADTDDIFLGPLHQIKAQTWSNGRCVLAGDAAHCPTPYTGMGTTLAIIGAYLLANELVAHEHHAAAFAAYERHFRPFVEAAQKLPPGVPNMAYAQSTFKVGLINAGAAFGASAPVQALISLFSGSPKEQPNTFDLPDYTSG